MRHDWGLRGRLLLLLLAFGVIPLGVVFAVGYTVSRRVITEQAQRALGEVTSQQALHLATELNRERLLLRTIAGQLPARDAPAWGRPDVLARLLVQGLPEGGVFDGLRLVGDRGVLASVALRPTATQWPDSAPAADWTERHVVVHREGGRVLAYLLAMPATVAPAVWIEGHVRAEDLPAVFGLPEHLMGGVELVVIDGDGEVLVVGHEHAERGLGAAFAQWHPDTVIVGSVVLDDAAAFGAAAPVEGTDWLVGAALPTDVALAPLTRLRDTVLVGMLILVAVIVATGTVASGSVTRPIRELTAAARRIGRAGTYEHARAAGSGEVGELVRAFDRMADDLRRSRSEIEWLHQTEMERAQQLATVGELASGVAHEVRNPLTGVRGAIDLALRGLSDDDASRPLLEEAQRQLSRIENTTTQLLRFARPPEVRELLVDANDLAGRAVHVVAPRADRAGVRLVAEPSREPVRVRADPELIVQVLVNLLLNAVEVSAEGASVTLWVARHAPEVWFGVRDAGPGVATELRDKVFRPFFTTKGQGTGLGLSISQQIAARHHGSLRIEDTPGGGATFVLALPLVDAQGDPDG